MASPDAIEHTLDAIRAQGGRVTDQRRAILSALFEESDHVTAESLAQRVQDRLPDVHLTTVYRFLETLQDMGLVSHVHLGHGPAVFHLTDQRVAHVVCEGCGRFIVVDEQMLARWSDALRRTQGFELVDQHFALAGRCPACRG